MPAEVPILRCRNSTLAAPYTRAKPAGWECAAAAAAVADALVGGRSWLLPGCCVCVFCSRAMQCVRPPALSTQVGVLIGGGCTPDV